MLSVAKHLWTRSEASSFTSHSRKRVSRGSRRILLTSGGPPARE